MKFITTNEAPQAIGPYSQAVQAGDFLYISGQLPINPNTDKFISDNIVEQTTQVMKNIIAILTSQGLSIKNIVKTNIYVVNLAHFNEINDAYGTFLNDHKPARSAIEVNKLPKNAQIEIEAIAYIKQ
ncbi:RidA family protein [Staphylococcus gallinarum]|uniref:RidA family protein n=1 Tax=Staphylococcus gallinarum TaxID=1293 RepID=UPI001E300313|nr:Rid family detoxifying hydrolase [Staphylococcus gallinarum]MCD8828862.1 Rid family detoxifying hydrolase [Staphylococcus gallinarum]MEB6055609.1 Rid family detoxifying hydrolase [Staphylococcus gallinarum]